MFCQRVFVNESYFKTIESKKEKYSSMVMSRFIVIDFNEFFLVEEIE
jgi:hypothetical protein